MGRTYIGGWETNDGASGVLEGAQGPATFDTTTVRSGTYSGKVVPASGASAYFQLSHSPTTGYYRVYVRVTVRPATTARFLIGNFGSVNLRLNPDGTIAYYNDTTLIGTSTTALTDTTKWYRVEFRIVDGTSVTVLQIDGNAEVTGSPASWSWSQLVGCPDAVADTYTAYFDDLAVDNAAFPGDGKVVLLVPTADSAVGTGWTLGTGTAITGGSGSTAVKNRPPLGVADQAAGSDTKQIRNAANSANSNYDATMTTYSAAGIAAGDTINGVMPIIATAAPVTTSSKQGTVGVASNPAITNVALSADGTAGAFWAGTAAGTYPSGWKGSNGTVANAPSVTLGTAPVMRVTQVTASTRIAMVCFMGIYVDYTPGVVVQVPYSSPYPQLLPQ